MANVCYVWWLASQTHGTRKKDREKKTKTNERTNKGMGLDRDRLFLGVRVNLSMHDGVLWRCVEGACFVDLGFC